MATVVSENPAASGCSDCSQSEEVGGFSAFGRFDSTIRVSGAKPIIPRRMSAKDRAFPVCKVREARVGLSALSRAGSR